MSMKPISLFSLFLVFQLQLPAQIITSYAGTGIGGNTGDGGLATVANINYPTGGAFDKYGNYYFGTGSVGNSVRKIDVNGIITTFAGTGMSGYSGDGALAINARLKGTSSVAIDSAGNVYIADAGNNRVRKVDINTGVISTVAGDGSAGFYGDGGPAHMAKFSVPNDICFDSQGRLYISDYGNGRIRKIDLSGTISTFAGGSTNYTEGAPANTVDIGSPWGICIDDSDNIFIVNKKYVRKVNSNGIITTLAGNGDCGTTGDGGLAVNAEVCPWRVTVDKLGRIYFSEDYYDKIRRINPDGMIEHFAGSGDQSSGGDNGPATLAGIHRPFGLSLDSCGNLFICESWGLKIRKVHVNPPCFPLQIQETVTNPDVQIYPNPATDLVHINANGLEVLEIRNSLGQLLMRKQIGEKAEIDISSYASGVYFFFIKNSVGQAAIRKVVKQ